MENVSSVETAHVERSHAMRRRMHGSSHSHDHDDGSGDFLTNHEQFVMAGFPCRWTSNTAKSKAKPKAKPAPKFMSRTPAMPTASRWDRNVAGAAVLVAGFSPGRELQRNLRRQQRRQQSGLPAAPDPEREPVTGAGGLLDSDIDSSSSTPSSMPSLYSGSDSG